MARLSETKSEKIQLLRGLAIIAVVFIHNTPGGLWQVYCRPFLNFSVGLFLFLSGMLSNAKHWNPGKRIGKVLVPYVLWTAVYVLLSGWKTPAKLPAAFLEGLIFADSSAVMYYIFVYIQCTLLIPLIDRAARTKWRYLPLLITPLAILFLRLMPMVLEIPLSPLFRKIRSVYVLDWFAFFYLGYLMGNGYVKLKPRPWGWLWAGATVLQILEGHLYLALGQSNCGTQVKLTSVLTALICCVMAFGFIESEKPAHCKLLKLLGDCSFGIYFSHLAVMKLLKQLPHYSALTPYPINALVAVAASLGFVLLGRKLLGKYAKYLAF